MKCIECIDFYYTIDLVLELNRNLNVINQWGTLSDPLVNNNNNNNIIINCCCSCEQTTASNIFMLNEIQNMYT